MHSSNATMKMRTMRFIRAEAAFSEQVRSFFVSEERPPDETASKQSYAGKHCKLNRQFQHD